MNGSSAQRVGESSSSPRHWSARLALEFAHVDGRTRLTASEHYGPLRVQRLFHPEACGKAHCYLLHPPGGVVMGDELDIRARLHRGRALLTTPSAGRFYSVDGHDLKQRQTVTLSVDEGLLEWLPQETILFSGADACLHTQIDLRSGAQLAYWDVLVLGRPASGERFSTGGVEQRLTVQSDGRVSFHESLSLCAGDRVHRSSLGLNNASTAGVAIFTATLPEEILGAWARSSEALDPDSAYVITQRGEFLIARYRGEDAQRCRAAFAELWRQVGTARDGTAPEQPRIWHT